MHRSTDYNILLIDDELNILKLYSALLKRNGYQVTEFISAVQALKFLDETEDKVDLIIADVNMPEMSGIEFLKKIKEKPNFNSIPLVFLSAIADSAVHVEAFDIGAVDFLTKPVKKEIFLSKIKSLLRSYALKTFRENIFIEGTNNDKSLEDIVAACEAEHLSGFTCVYNAESKGVLHFKGGMLEDIECGRLRGPQAYETMSAWSDFRFTAVHGDYNENLARQIRSQIFYAPKGSSIKQSYPGPDRRKRNRIKGAVERFQFLDNGLVPDKLKYHNVYELYAQFTRTISSLVGEIPNCAQIEFTDQKILNVASNHQKIEAILFENRKAWQEYQEKNESNK